MGERHWIDDTVDRWLDKNCYEGCSECVVCEEELRSYFHKDHEKHCEYKAELTRLRALQLLDEDMAQRIAEEVIEDCKQAQRMGSTAADRFWMPTSWNIKQIILCVADEAGKEKDGNLG